MKKLIKHKLFNQNGCSKNYLLWEISDGNEVTYEFVEEFKGHSIGRTKLRGRYQNRLSAFTDFKKAILTETSAVRRVPFGRRLVYS